MLCSVSGGPFGGLLVEVSRHSEPACRANPISPSFPARRRRLGLASARVVQLALPRRTCEASELGAALIASTAGAPRPPGTRWTNLSTARSGSWRSPGPRSRPTPVARSRSASISVSGAPSVSSFSRFSMEFITDLISLTDSSGWNSATLNGRQRVAHRARGPMDILRELRRCVVSSEHLCHILSRGIHEQPATPPL